MGPELRRVDAVEQLYSVGKELLLAICGQKGAQMFLAAWRIAGGIQRCTKRTNMSPFRAMAPESLASVIPPGAWE